MKVSKEGIDLIKHFESCRLKAYLDSVLVPTIGYGHTKTTVMGMEITQEQADELLRQDLEYFEKKVLEYVEVPLTQNQFDALVSFTFNVGEGGLKKSSVLKWINKQEFEKAADSFLLWNKAGNQILKGLVRRRNAERLLFLKPETSFKKIIAELEKTEPRPVEEVKKV